MDRGRQRGDCDDLAPPAAALFKRTHQKMRPVPFLEPEKVEIIQRTWAHLKSQASPTELLSSFRNNQAALAPCTQVVFAALPLAEFSESFVTFITEFLMHGLEDEECFRSKMQDLLPGLIQIEDLQKNVPAMHRAVLFWVWQMCEHAGLQYTDKIANAHSALVQQVSQLVTKRGSFVTRATVDPFPISCFLAR